MATFSEKMGCLFCLTTFLIRLTSLTYYVKLTAENAVFFIGGTAFFVRCTLQFIRILLSSFK